VTARLRWAALAAVSYLPLLLTAPGQVAADTKAYLYLDPARLLSRAVYLWDQNVAAGTVTHQNIGYLWPMGPWFWAFDRLGLPDWIAQRLWMGTLLLVAGAGVVYLGRTIGPRVPWAWTAGAFAYLLSPYVLDYVSRISVLLLPWAALPWLVALTHLSLVRRRWREPAIFALVVATAGGINATALVLAGLGPVLWVLFAVAVHREVTAGDATRTVLRLGSLTVLTNAWWIAGLAVQSGWGLDVLRYTETIETVARSSMSSEVLRGLGYWFFYGTDKLGPWIEPGRTFTELWPLILVGFVLPVGAVAATFVVRWRYRAYAACLVVVGVAVAVGAFPYRDPSPVGGLFKSFATSSTAGLALRSTARAVPLVVLGLAMLLAAGLAAATTRRPRVGAGLTLAVVLLALAANPALWTGGFVASNLRHPEEVPEYWQQAARWLGAKGDTTRVLELPGSDFATYRWGNHVDPITPGLMDRPWLARELIPYGTEASADLLLALDARIQTGTLDPDALAPIARLFGIGDVVVRGDLQYERYRTARPAQVWALLEAAGLGAPRTFGPAGENLASPALPLRDEIHLQTKAGAVRPPVGAFPVEDPLPIARTRSAEAPLLFEGDGTGLVDAAGAGLLGGDAVLLSAPGLANRADVLRDALAAPGARLVVTDTNRTRARRWGTVRDNTGYTERARETPLVADPSDNRLPLFPDAPVSSATTVEQRGVVRVQASAYGNPVSYTPADRPANAFDGDLTTAWSVGALGPVGGQRLLVETKAPVTTDHIDVVQARQGPRHITRLGIRLDGHHIGDVALDDRSFTGQRLELEGPRTFRTLELVIEQDSAGRRANYADQNGVGLAEVHVGDVRVDEVVRLPSTLLDQSGRRSLAIVLTRLRANPAEPFARDEERNLVRTFRLPTSRTFTLSGTAAVAATLPDDRLDALLGGRAGVVARSSGRLPGAVASRASAAVDGDPATAWVNHFGEQVGAWLEVERTVDTTIDRLDLRAVDDGDHSVPTRVSITNEHGERRTASPGETFSPLTGRRFRVTLDAVRPVTTIDWFSQAPIAMPVAIAELGLPVAPAAAPPPTTCRTDLLTIDGDPVPVRLTAGRVEACGPLTLGRGDHLLRSALGAASGYDVDQLVLTTDPVGAATPVADRATDVEVVGQTRVSWDLRVTGSRPTWLVLGQSWSRGWRATADGRDLGAPVLVDGYANGWLVEPGQTVHLQWTPQRIVWTGLAISALGVLLCLIILLRVALTPSRVAGATRAHDPAGASWRDGPFRSGPAAGWRAVAVASVATGTGVGLVVHPLIGVATAAATVIALRWRYGRIAGAAAAGLVAAAGSYTAAKQWRNDFPADFGWTDFFHPAHFLAWSGLALLVVLLVSDAVRRRR
jgi:arabinofuranan 3-O-arabinosyltransferase